MTPLQQEIHELSVRHAKVWQAARNRETSPYWREKAEEAWAKLFWNDVDIISQRHGLPPMLRRAP